MYPGTGKRTGEWTKGGARQKSVVRVFLAIIFSIAFGSACADERCDSEIVEAVGKHFDIKNFKLPAENGVIVAATCKAWPYKENIVLSVFAYSAEPANKEDMEPNRELLVVMLDKHSGTIISSYRDTIVEDAMTEVEPDSFRLDTARYQLAKDVRAFGLRFHSGKEAPSCAENAFYDELTLFARSGDKLRPVFRQFMNVERTVSGCRGMTPGQTSWEDASLSIAIENTTSHGYADLKISAFIEPGTDMEPPPPAMNMNKRMETYLLRFDGNAYSPAEEVPWWGVQ